jgi:hypothetical protein
MVVNTVQLKSLDSANNLFCYVVSKFKDFSKVFMFIWKIFEKKLFLGSFYAKVPKRVILWAQVIL